MNLEATIRRFRGELRSPACPASRDNLMCYDWDPYSRFPTNRHGAAFKKGWRAAQEVLKDRRDFYRPATLRRLAWCNLGYRFVMWQDAKGQESCDRARAYEMFKRVLVGEPPSPSGRGAVVEPRDPRTFTYLVMTKQKARLATKAETKLLRDYCRHIRRKHRELKSWRWEGNLQCDGYEEARNNLIEAKASCRREDIRMAVGELFDYEFLGRTDFKKPNKAILLPREPDLESFEWLGDLKIYFVWKEKDVFLDNAKGQFI